LGGGGYKNKKHAQGKPKCSKEEIYYRMMITRFVAVVAAGECIKYIKKRHTYRLSLYRYAKRINVSSNR